MSIAQNFPNIKPSLMLSFADTRQLDSRVTFTRSTPAVYYDGKTTAMAEQNLLLYSQDFDNAIWAKQGVTITANLTTAPDGTTTADSWTCTNSTNHQLYQGIQKTGVHTFSIYVKANGYNGFYFGAYNNNQFSYFDLSSGTVSSNVGGAVGAIQSVGNSWYRCSVVLSSGVSVELQLGFLDAVYSGISTAPYNISTAVGTTGYIWGAQFEQRSAATAYTATTTQPITNYIPVLLTAGGNQPRFDCNPTTGESLGLLIEEQRTNIATYSSVNTSGWVSVSSTLTNNYATSPDGTTSAGYLADDTNNVQHSLYQTVTLANATSYSFSAYIKSYGRNYAEIIPFGTPTGNTVVGASFNLSNGTVSATTGAVTATITSVGNGWYRCSVIYTTVASGALNFNIFPSIGPNVGDRVYTGNGFSGLLVWGAQAEAGAFATSYIATTSASATRTADLAQMTGANFTSWFNANEGTILANSTTMSASEISPFAIEGTSPSRLRLSLTSSNFAYALYQNSGGSYVSISTYPNTVPAANLFNTSAMTYSMSQVRVATQGTAAVSGTVAFSPTALTYLTIGTSPTDGSAMYQNGRIKKIAYYPIAVTATQLQALTS